MDDLEIKFEDTDGSVYQKRYSMNNVYTDWCQVVVYIWNTGYVWGGSDTLFNVSKNFELAFSGDSMGTVWIDEIGIGKPGSMPGFYLDPYRESEGNGFLQRRYENALPENAGLYRYLELMQDHSTTDGRILANDENTTYVSTFNNALAAIAFIIKDDSVRAGKILDFYAARTDSGNTNIDDQQFFYNGNAMGFYQQINKNTYHRAGSNEDRWIGDIAWLLLAYQQFGEKYCLNEEYQHVGLLIRDLLVSFYKETDDDCGCIMTGWQDGDSRFDSTCHYEGNIDCFAALRNYGDMEYSQKVRNWLLQNLTDYDQPLDNYTWLTLALNEEDDSLLNIPEYDFRFRKKIHTGNDSIYGFYPFPNMVCNNVWTDGTGHMAAAQYVAGNTPRGNFYAGQFDPLLLSYELFGEDISTLPYAFNKECDFGWIDTTIGSVSPCAWYVIGKNRINPMYATEVNICPPVVIDDLDGSENTGISEEVYPNPFSTQTTLEYTITERTKVEAKIYDHQGKVVKTLISDIQKPGEYSFSWNGKNDQFQDVPSGIYFLVLTTGDNKITYKLNLVRYY